MRIVCISDTHMQLDKFEIPDGDVLVHAGDMTGRGRAMDINGELQKLIENRHKHIVFIAGNHDWLYEKNNKYAREIIGNFNQRSGGRLIYLQDQQVEIDGVTFYGSPWQPEFCNWAFNLHRNSPELRYVCEKIPSGIDVLITHGPPHKILDLPGGKYRFDPDGTPRHVGCEILAKEVIERVKPQLHVFGHIHGSYGEQMDYGIHFVNASSCNESYEPVNAPIVVDIEPRSSSSD